MRKRYSYRVCRCTPNEGVVQLETRLLRHIVNYRIRSIRCAQNSRMKYHFGLHLGQLCATSGHPWWAIKVWQFTLRLMCWKDYDEWIYVPVNPDYVRIDSVLSEPESMDLGRRIVLLGRCPARHNVPDSPNLVLIIISVAQDAESSSPAIFHSRKLAPPPPVLPEGRRYSQL